MEHLILHIGSWKTGSTALQSALAHTRRGPDWVHLHPDVQNGTRVMLAAIGTPEEVAAHWHLPPEIDADPKRWIEDQMRANQTPRATFSGEGLLTVPEAQITQILEMLRAHTRKVTAVGYIRHPFPFCLSAFQEELKWRYHPLSDLTRMGISGVTHGFDRWRSIIGPENLMVVPYDRARFPGGSIVEDFAQRFDLGSLVGPTRTNTSLSGEAMRLLMQYRRRTRDRGEKDWIMAAQLQTLGGTRFSVAHSVWEPAFGRMLRVRDWVLQHTGWDMGFELPEPGPRAIEAEADFDDILPETLDWLAERTDTSLFRLKFSRRAVATAVGKLAELPIPPDGIPGASKPQPI